jgi:hypothetical protein
MPISECLSGRFFLCALRFVGLLGVPYGEIMELVEHRYSVYVRTHLQLSADRSTKYGAVGKHKSSLPNL